MMAFANIVMTGNEAMMAYFKIAYYPSIRKEGLRKMKIFQDIGCS
jgi:hypothetical protein